MTLSQDDDDSQEFNRDKLHKKSQVRKDQGQLCSAGDPVQAGGKSKLRQQEPKTSFF